MTALRKSHGEAEQEAEFAPLPLLGCRALGVSCQDLWGGWPGHLALCSEQVKLHLKYTKSIPLISYFRGRG